jgi:hypothetical protein
MLMSLKIRVRAWYSKTPLVNHKYTAANKRKVIPPPYPHPFCGGLTITSLTNNGKKPGPVVIKKDDEPLLRGYEPLLKREGAFMSFCLILSTLCRQVVFHIVPHFGKRAGQKVQRKIAAAVQKSKIPSTFCPAILKSAKQIVNNHSFCFSHQTDQG